MRNICLRLKLLFLFSVAVSIVSLSFAMVEVGDFVKAMQEINEEICKPICKTNGKVLVIFDVDEMLISNDPEYRAEVDLLLKKELKETDLFRLISIAARDRKVDVTNKRFPEFVKDLQDNKW